MATAFNGSLAWTGAHPLQLGGPPLVSTWSRPLAKTALPLIAHIYDNDGVTFKVSFSVLNRPTLSPTLANGGYNQVLLSGASSFPAAIYGQVLYGQAVYGGRVVQGNVIRLTEDGGPWPGFIYSGIVEDLPESISPTGVSHQILLSPLAVELDDTFSQAVYTTPVDVSQIVRDAVALTMHCHCDQASVPPSIGIAVPTTGKLDFSNQSVRSVIDTCRSIAGPTFFWHCDELGRVWFQPMGSGAVYTVPMAQYEQRTKSASIQNRKNKVVAVGGTPPGSSANVTAFADDLVSQRAIGIRALSPPLQIPTITDRFGLQLIASNILAVLDRTWLRVDLKLLPAVGVRIHASQPGGPMLRYWEPTQNPLQESSVGVGYTGPFIAQSLTYDGMYQDVVAGDIPVTSQTDIDNMVKQWAHREMAWRLSHSPLLLADQQQVFTGTVQSGATTPPTSQWQLTQSGFALYDSVGVLRAGVGNLPALGISPAGPKFQLVDGNNNLIADSNGLIAVANLLGQTFNFSWSTSSTTDVSLSGIPVTFSLLRTTNVLAIACGTASNGGSGGTFGYGTFFVDGVNAGHVGPYNGPKMVWPIGEGYKSTTLVKVFSLGAGSHTIDCRVVVDNANLVLTGYQMTLDVFAMGG